MSDELHHCSDEWQIERLGAAKAALHRAQKDLRAATEAAEGAKKLCEEARARFDAAFQAQQEAHHVLRVAQAEIKSRKLAVTQCEALLRTQEEVALTHFILQARRKAEQP